MIDLNIDIDGNYILKRFKITGHSNFNDKGKDIVCAGVSILVYSFLAALKKMPDADIDFYDDVNEMNLLIKDFNSLISGELKGITLLLISGLKLLEKDYKTNIRLNIKQMKIGE